MAADRADRADRKHILVVEDEQDIVDLLNYHLSREGFAVSVAMTGEDCLNSVLQKRPDLILLDIMLPGMSGLDVCRKLKRESKTAGIQIIIISAKGEESDVVTGFELGADDYITKPFSVKILISRIRTTLRRANSQTGYTQKSELHLRDLDICPNRFQVVAYGKTVDGLTLMEFKLLHLLAAVYW